MERNMTNRQREIARRFDERYRQDNTPWTRHPPEPMVDRFLTLMQERKPGASILDIGCGDGWLSLKAAEKGFRVWGLDSSETAIERARAESERRGVSDRVEFSVGNALELEYEDDAFDAMMDRGLFHHILPENRPLYFDNILRVLKPKSYIYLSVFSTRSGSERNQFTRQDIDELYTSFRVVAFEEDPYPTTAPAHLLHFILERVR
jgi:ubiquinone/menaquinone biosynthesis C-methylase UbiE